MEDIKIGEDKYRPMIWGEEVKAKPEVEKIDKLCFDMLALGWTAEGTQKMRPSEVKDLLTPFFGKERILKCVDIICGKNGGRG